MTTPDHVRFGRIVAARRRELGLTLDDVAEKGGPSQVTTSGIEQGAISRPQLQTFKKLDAVLRWKPGSAARAFDGAEPEPVGGTRRRRRPQKIAATEYSVILPLSSVAQLLQAAKNLESLTERLDSAELKEISRELDLHVDRILRTWIIAQVEGRLRAGDHLKGDVMIEMLLGDYLARTPDAVDDEDVEDLLYLRWLLGRAPDTLTAEQRDAFAERSGQPSIED